MPNKNTFLNTASVLFRLFRNHLRTNFNKKCTKVFMIRISINR